MNRARLSSRFFGTLSHLAIPKYSRVKTIAQLLGISSKKVVDHFTFHEKKIGKYLLSFEGKWYEFQSSSDVIIPFDLAQKYATQIHKKKFQLLDFENIPPVQVDQHDKIPVIALLGHFNHGKTTLLDTFASSKLVAEESHGITQVSQISRDDDELGDRLFEQNMYS